MSDTRGDVSTPKIAVVGFLGVVILFAVIVLLVVVFYHVETQEEFVKDVSQPQVEFDQLAAQQRGNLADYRLLDKQKQVYAIPISRAMEMVVARRQKNPQGPPGVEPAGKPATGQSPPGGNATQSKPPETPAQGGQP